MCTGKTIGGQSLLSENRCEVLQSNLYFTMLTATHLDPDAGVVLDPLPSGGFWSG